MSTLTPGANTSVSAGVQTVTITYTPVAGADLDVSAFLLTDTGKVRGDNDMCFFGQQSVNNGAVKLVESAAGRTVFSLNLEAIDQAVEKVALTATIYENKAKFAAFPVLNVSISGGIEAPIPTQGMQETALILGEFYRRQGAWKFRCVAQGFAGGLAPLAQHFGVDIAAPAPSAAPTPAPAPVAAPAAPAPASKVNLSKITLDKQRPSISLDKKDGDFGEIKINLNWNRSSQNSGGGGFFASLRGKSGGIDLDVGCLYEMENGSKGAVQALGNAFGDFRDAPFIQLMGDDRTGSVSDGEWLRINGKEWRQIRRVLVYAFIYEGAPNWQATDGVITLYIPGEAPIEVRLSEEGGSKGMCAIALLENVGGSVRVNRKVEFFKGHSDMDKAFGWGMRWAAGSK
ncbi:TerD family protein [Pseudomonas lundensis]|uniref:Tellurium resistance protein TerA n=1 Tax=Pseudomonas lundensis TaxID=86185 RepID=A0ABX4GGM2_9PSED|nr:TerD family protein [Pseudomonas lundensis]NMZ56792.1 tellurium resistance protein TerA [Pseudomonas lundensis]OZY26173.1 tellurium resistance protein TerA [Pseudomonas lundensis]OZY44142.1 tellurium resistance protein TerA [Pseudomonas lundensis]OZY52737.1 tellurium resistance protein TerA [Pseudomonas lundensis]QOF90047.1 TerD family protein [Pseudomonas lundensis]